MFPVGQDRQRIGAGFHNRFAECTDLTFLSRSKGLQSRLARALPGPGKLASAAWTSSPLAGDAENIFVVRLFPKNAGSH